MATPTIEGKSNHVHVYACQKAPQKDSGFVMLKLRVRSAMTETSSEVGVKDPVSLCPRVGQLSLLSSRSASEKSGTAVL